jgi:3-dehydroquinate dehydratase-2
LRRLLILNGPNLNLLGEREPEIYGRRTLAETVAEAQALGAELGLAVDSFQSNHEGALIDRIHAARGQVDGLIVNPGGLTHSSVSLRDALAAAALPVVEVHLTNLARRESFRQVSLVSGVALGTISGFGPAGYLLAVRSFWHYFQTAENRSS